MQKENIAKQAQEARSFFKIFLLGFMPLLFTLGISMSMTNSAMAALSYDPILDTTPINVGKREYFGPSGNSKLLTITSSSASDAELIAGGSDGNGSDNTLIVNNMNGAINGTTAFAFVGGLGVDVDDNTIKGNTVYIGYVDANTPIFPVDNTSNTITVGGIAAALSSASKAMLTENHLHVSANIVAGVLASAVASDGSATGNSLTINGGKVSANGTDINLVVGGVASIAANNNTVTLGDAAGTHSTPLDLSETTQLFGGSRDLDGTNLAAFRTGNTLNLARNVALKATGSKVANFENYTFIINPKIAEDTTIPFLKAEVILLGASDNAAAALTFTFVERRTDIATGTEINLVLLQATGTTGSDLAATKLDAIQISPKSDFELVDGLSYNETDKTISVTLKKKAPESSISLTNLASNTFQKVPLSGGAINSKMVQDSELGDYPPDPATLLNFGSFEFQATGLPTGAEFVTFEMSFISNGSNIDGLYFEKLRDNRSIPYTLIDDTTAEADRYAEGNFWIVDTLQNPNAIISKDTVLTAGIRYTLYFVIKDDGAYDIKDMLVGTIDDPSRLTQRTVADDGDGDGGGGGGCTVGTSSAYDFALLLFALMGMVVFRIVAYRNK